MLSHKGRYAQFVGTSDNISISKLTANITHTHLKRFANNNNNR